MDLTVRLGKISLKNPITVASGTFGYGEEFSELIDLNQLGAIFVKGITLKQKKGNPPQRIIETPSGMLNSIGLQNVGIDEFVEKKIPFLKKYDTRIIVNINGETIEEYEALANLLEKEKDVHAIEINLSCPNVKAGGMHFGSDPEKIYEITSKIRKRYTKGILTKLSPNFGNIVEMAKAVKAAEADGVSMINTILGMAIDIRKRRPALRSIFGGLSGPAIKPVAIRMIYEVGSKVDIPILGGGGISTVDDVIEFLMAGSNAISVGTANFYNPLTAIDILKDLKTYMKESGFDKIEKIRKSLRIDPR